MRWVVLVLVLAWSGVAHASPSSGDQSYHGTIAVADAVSVAALVGGITMIGTGDSTGVRTLGVITTVVGAGGYIWASPVVHHLKGRRELAQLDIAMRVFIPGLSAGIAAGVMSCPNEQSSCAKRTDAIVLAGAVGIIITSAIDIRIFADYHVPYIGKSDSGAVAGIAGRF